MLDKIIVAIIVLSAIAYMLLRLRRNAKSGGCGCGCSGCSKDAHPEQNAVYAPSTRQKKCNCDGAKHSG